MFADFNPSETKEFECFRDHIKTEMSHDDCLHNEATLTIMNNIFAQKESTQLHLRCIQYLSRALTTARDKQERTQFPEEESKVHNSVLELILNKYNEP